MKKSTILFGVLRVILDFCVVVFALILSRDIRAHTDLIPGVQLPIGYIPSFEDYFPFVIAASFVLICILAFNGLYSFKTRLKLRQQFLSIAVMSTLWMMLIIAYFFLRRDFFFSRLVLVYAWVLAISFLSLGRFFLHSLQVSLLKKGIGVTNILFLGDSNLMTDIIRRFSGNKAYHVIGVVSCQKKEGFIHFTTMQELETFCAQKKVEEILQFSSLEGENISSESVLEYCRINHMRYRFIPDLLEIQRTNVEVWEEEGIPIIELKPTPLDGWGRVLKRVFDLVVSGMILVVISPILLLISLIVKLDSRGPVFFFQKRVGYHGKEFLLIKFRTMVENAEALKRELLEKNERQGPLFKIKNDPRITRIGNFLRKWSLDELPQLFNVFIGTMSLVGPRPHLPSEVAQYEKHHRLLLTIKPGITGMSQINGRSGLDFEEEVRFDVYYIQNWSLLVDIVVILKTFFVVLKKENAD